jgi:hypothetical protein
MRTFYNSKLDVLRYQTRLLLDFNLLSHKRYQYVGQHINDIGVDLGSWIKQQQYKVDRKNSGGRRQEPRMGNAEARSQEADVAG